MKLSISLPDEDVDRLDEFARSAGLPTRSAAVQHAIRLLDSANLEAEYASAWDEWEASGEQATWEGTVGDGLAVASR
jgi:Arc/MetJ-type ribon-helix-helix transcriptional regulator